MPKPPSLFSCIEELERGFANGLAAMLAQHQGLGVYILALANAAYDPALWQILSGKLNQRHQALCALISSQLRNNQDLQEPDDDVMVFLKLMAIGFEHLHTMQIRKQGVWQLSFNPIRALRPPRISGQQFGELLRSFDANGFHFNKPFLDKEILWQGELAGKPARILYNKFPFARLHGLLVPEPARQLPQFLTPEQHSWAWEVCAQNSIPGFCLGYNSTGAGASVNHLHFQSFVQTAPLAVHDPSFSHNGGNLNYPLPCQCFKNANEAWLWLDTLHHNNQPYNLVYSADTLHVIPRAAQGSAQIPAHCQGYGWSEAAGVMNLFHLAQYQQLTASEIEQHLARLTP